MGPLLPAGGLLTTTPTSHWSFSCPLWPLSCLAQFPTCLPATASCSASCPLVPLPWQPVNVLADGWSCQHCPLCLARGTCSSPLQHSAPVSLIPDCAASTLDLGDLGWEIGAGSS